MKRIPSSGPLRAIGAVSLFTCCMVLGSGCSTQSLKDQNRRLKESNDRLISENNRLEEELAAAQKRPAEGKSPDSPALDAPTAAPAEVAKSGTKVKAPPLIEGLGDDVEVFESKQGTRIRIPDRVFFSLGQATLSTRGQKILDKVAKLINSHPNQMVRVDGHTDDTPIRKVRNLYPTNWELSSARACTVVRYLVDKGSVSGRRIYPAGFSFYRPVASGKTTDARSQNRRVEITLLNESV